MCTSKCCGARQRYRHKHIVHPASWELLIPTSNATSNWCYFAIHHYSTHSMSYCLFSVFAIPWFTIQYTNMLWWTRQISWTVQQSLHTIQHQSLLHTHSTITSTDRLMHYGWLKVRECSHTWWLGTCTLHSTIHCLLQSAFITFILCRKSAPKVSHSSCTRLWWP